MLCIFPIRGWGYYPFWEHEASLGFLILKHFARKFLFVALRIKGEGLTTSSTCVVVNTTCTIPTLTVVVSFISSLYSVDGQGGLVTRVGARKLDWDSRGSCIYDQYRGLTSAGSSDHLFLRVYLQSS